MIPHPHADPDAWEVLRINGKRMPGLATVKSGKRGRKIDTRSAPGSNGARIVDKGYEPGRAVIDLVLWLAEHLQQWEDLQPSLAFTRETRVQTSTQETEEAILRALPSTGASTTATVEVGQRADGTPVLAEQVGSRVHRTTTRTTRTVRDRAAVRMEHAGLAMHGLSLVYVETISTGEWRDDRITVTLSVIEYTPEQARAGRVVSPAPTGQTLVASAPLDARYANAVTAPSTAGAADP